ncbi:N-hydroxyarylamine O-acetyltransferase [Sphingomonas metalli]|uniref:N-hydroxyarylamine O-acetyltransferase n=1 Tax=Sphingomonas metalli TaxID=1779358 RepID=A0A916WRQ1_9SPHN|nr:arylamine N-acetyltransferase [Sphingomonas metalli]GGB26422.1 N-hydroxyarylamine O-acetyltransferase [Sphingomonas metalli]
MFDLDAYLTRIDMPARPTRDAAGLARLQRAHRLAIPFENLDVILGRGIAIDSEAVFAKLVTTRRGGYCFEQNRLFGDALSALGFAHQPLLARVWLGVDPAEDAVPPLTHTFSLVEADGRAWIADPGFGGAYSPILPLEEGAEAEAPDGARFRLIRDAAHGWVLERHGPAASTDGRGSHDGWQAQYSFSGEPAVAADLAMGNLWASTAPGTRFTTLRIASIVLPHGFASLTDAHYRRVAAGTENAGAITDPRVYRMRLSLMFGIDLSVEEVAALGVF